MAVKHRNVILVTLLCSFIIFVEAQNEFIPYVKQSDCETSQYFNISLMECKSCPINTTKSADGFSCVCGDGFKFVVDLGPAGVQCEKCPANQVRSTDGYRCVEDNVCSTANSIAVERTLDGTIINVGGVETRQCEACVATTTPDTIKGRCVRCNHILNVIPGTSCSCGTPQQAGGLCFPNTNEYTSLIASGSQDFVPLSSGTALSAYMKDNLIAAYFMCRTPFKNATACQVLGNLCALSYYSYSSNYDESSACNMYKSLTKEDGNQWPEYMPWLYYSEGGQNAREGESVLDDDKLTTEYRFSPQSLLEFRVARYTLNGTFLGVSNVGDGRMQLCSDTTLRLDAAYTFGTYYSQSCSIPALDLWNRNKYPLEFFDLYIEFTKDSLPQLYAIPLRILNLAYSGSAENQGSNSKNWILVRRFFLVDNVVTTGASTTSDPEFVRYAKSIDITVTLYSTLGNGRIYPPYVTVSYDQMSRASAEEGATITPTFSVSYSMDLTQYRRDFQIAVGTLSTMGIIYAGYKTWVWSKRAGRLAIDFASIVNFIFYVSGVLSNVFFVISFGIAFYFLVFYKRQSVVYLFLLKDTPYEEWLGLYGAAFALKCLQVAHLVFQQCTVDIFFIDWERPKSGGTQSKEGKKENPVSIWRTYFAANEWNEIQTTRKINHIFQIFAVVFFLNYVGFENVATKDPNGKVIKLDTEYKAEYSPMFRYAVAALTYLLVAIVQWIFFTFIYERFIEDKVRQFVDLCSMSNISVFVMQHAQFGYYIHGRSVHGKADTNMKEMCDMMKREGEDLCGKRGLLPDTEQQTFVMSLPRKLRLKYEEVMLPVALEGAGAVSAGAGKDNSGITEKQVEAYNIVNKFFAGFIDHSLKSLDYVVKDKTLLESIMDTEFLDASEKGIFYNDDGHSFDQCLFYGNEVTLLLFDTLLFCIVDLIAKNFVLAGIISYIIIELIALIRDSGGRKNLAKKTLVDERFLI